MKDERNGLDDTLSVASTSANVVKGAVKTGKAIAAATKGASVGGPYQAHQMAGRRHYPGRPAGLMAL